MSPTTGELLRVRLYISTVGLAKTTGKVDDAFSVVVDTRGRRY